MSGQTDTLPDDSSRTATLWNRVVASFVLSSMLVTYGGVVGVLGVFTLQFGYELVFSAMYEWARYPIGASWMLFVATSLYLLPLYAGIVGAIAGRLLGFPLHRLAGQPARPSTLFIGLYRVARSGYWPA